tara:strand:- start:231 stop:491 length:261 start_codon:yes stop_codon:yes gene_type:complete
MMEIKTFDDDVFAVDAESYFYLWCCDCDLRHLVVVDAIGKGADVFKSDGGKVAIAMSRDHAATNLARKEDKIVLYRRDKKSKDAKR